LPLSTLADDESAAEVSALGDPVSTETLAEQRGGDDEFVHNTIRVNGTVTDNSATNVVTGANSIADGSFANSSGIMSVVQNTGANVLIQSATIVNVQFADP
ncbi:MAG TPA: hypothetical protein VJP84_04070, partial [Steroidobacteraceae bacterium]|nr:hypothetical protein [Steroidobacteraceae bacterium]